tara:strand:+ start:731 stop:907 length:177 start_codon:yes stop_codon:yes gene_type:complete
MDDREKVNKNKVIKYVQEKFEDAKQMSMFKFLRKEVEVNGTGTHKYRIKEGPNKGKVL